MAQLELSVSEHLSGNIASTALATPSSTVAIIINLAPRPPFFILWASQNAKSTKNKPDRTSIVLKTTEWGWLVTLNSLTDPPFIKSWWLKITANSQLLKLSAASTASAHPIFFERHAARVRPTIKRIITSDQDMRHIALPLNKRIPVHPSWALIIVSASVLFTGLLTVGSVLLALLHQRRTGIVISDARFTLLTGLTFIYLASLLRRGKHTAWMIALPLFAYLVVRNLRHFIVDLPDDAESLLPVILNLLIPAIALFGLISARRLFTVRSELRSFPLALQRAALVLLIAFLYGVVGFQLLDTKDFRQEIPLFTGAHYTVDQFDLTTVKTLEPHTQRARLFLDSLGFISVGALFYVGAALFAPIRFRLGPQQHEYELMQTLLKSHPSSSEDFFKLWPRDKAYFFNQKRTAGLAYRATHGVALVVGDPAGRTADFGGLLAEFMELCRVNDWEPALIHTEPTFAKLYAHAGLEIQKIGEEAIIDTTHFVKNVMPNKYFRHIANKFEKQNYSCEVLGPPHNDSVIRRLAEISNDWLKVPGRSEYGFMMGYFSAAYMQQCPLMVVRDAAGTIQAFVNQIPSFNPAEANFDLLRHTSGSPGNINDYLMLNFISYLRDQGFAGLNMGLCPLAGLEAEETQRRSALDSVLGLVYANAGRFYSFKGLRRFKSKYEPQWQDRFIAYQGGLRGITKVLNSQWRAMRIRRRPHL